MAEGEAQVGHVLVADMKVAAAPVPKAALLAERGEAIAIDVVRKAQSYNFV